MRPTLRLLPLPLCIACALATPPAVAQSGDKPPDYSLCPVVDAVPAFADAQPPVGDPDAREAQPTDIAGDMLDGIDGETLNYSGNVTLRRGDQFLGADNLTYDSEAGTYVADGSIRYQDSAMRLEAERLEGDQNDDTHRVDNVRYQLTQRRGNGGADRVEIKGDQGSFHGSTYSTCPPDERLWELRAGRIDIDNEKGMGVARNATLRVGKVPVLYIPWFPFPTDDRRRTGLLYPTVSLSGRNGFDWRQPIYLNLAPNFDMTLEPRLMTKRGFLLGTEFRYLTDSGAGEFDIELFPSDKLAEDGRQREIELGIPEENRRKDDRGSLRFRGHENLGDQWQARADLNWISDPRYLEDMSSNVGSFSSYQLLSSAGVFGRGRNWEAGLMADHWQLSDYTLRDFHLPYNRLPRLYGRWEEPFQPWLVAGVDAELVRFEHTDSATRPGGSRLDLMPYISFPLEGASWFVKPTFAWRYTGYALDQDMADSIALGNGSPTADTSPSRSLPVTTVDAGLFFDRQASWGGESYLQTLEPRIFYLKSPYRDQSDLPLFDTQPLTFSYGQLFRDNRYSGADRQADADQLTLALSTRLINEEDGREKLFASIGQIRYFDDSRVTVPGEVPLDRSKSAWIADASYAINDRWSVSATYQWDPKFRREDLASIRTRYLIGDDGVVNFSYRNRRDLLQQVDFSFLYPLTPAWSLVGRYYYSLQDHQLLEAIAGVQWDSCCLAVRLVGRRYLRNRLGELNDAIQLEIELKGLGSAGPDTERRLRRAILGYYRDDLYLVPPLQVQDGDDRDANTPLPDPIP
ncbi:LPS assembly protein LptD [Luteimonas vadosa]|uniref:LPS-assembly protein LptD n=1 Tax=Luteimonas vadosa TaxID=1165507 RepID=A0ABP9E7J7_9GAMM